jgi:hypothetical protein
VGFVGAASAEVERNGAVSVSAIGVKRTKDEPKKQKKRVFQTSRFERMQLLNPRAVTKVAMPGQPAADGSSSNEPARRAGAMRPSLLAVDLLRSLLARI